MRAVARRVLERSPMLDGLFRRIVWSRVHYPERELRLLEAMPGRQLDVAVDVGAALGSYAWVLNRKARTVFAFEPGAKHFAHLEAAARWSHVEIVRAALGAETGTARLHTPGDSNEARHMATLSEDNPVIRTAGTVSEVVPVYALDVFLQDRLGPGELPRATSPGLQALPDRLDGRHGGRVGEHRQQVDQANRGGLDQPEEVG